MNLDRGGNRIVLLRSTVAMELGGGGGNIGVWVGECVKTRWSGWIEMGFLFLLFGTGTGTLYVGYTPFSIIGGLSGCLDINKSYLTLDSIFHMLPHPSSNSVRSGPGSKFNLARSSTSSLLLISRAQCQNVELTTQQILINAR